MQTFLRIDVNLFMAVVCAIIYFSSKRTSESRLMHNQLFRWLILCVFALLILESFTWILDGSKSKSAILFNYLVTICLYLLTPLPSFLWELYVKLQLFPDPKSVRTDVLAFGIPIAVSYVLTLTSPFTNLMFRFDASHVYHRGVLYPILAIISLLPILVSFFSILIHRKRLTRKYARMLLIVPLLIVAASILQIIFYGLSLIWSSISLALLLAYMRIQGDQVYLDHLTGVFNRRQMDIYLADKIRTAQDGRSFSCVLLDIDHFKTVNDKLGHVAGDEALKDASNILKSSIRKGDFLARYGGDEFFIVTDIDDEHSLRSLINRINENSQEFNRSMQRPYLISFSAGETIYDPKRKWTREQLICFVDGLMYQNKYESVQSEAKNLEET